MDRWMTLISRLVGFMDDPERLVELRFFLPCFYVNLDPQDVPDIGSLDSSLIFDPVARAVSSLEALAWMHQQMVELWPGVWHWISFIDAFWDSIPGASLPDDYDRTTMYRHFTSLAVFMGHRCYPTPDELIWSTNGIRTFLTRAWSYLLRVDCSQRAKAGGAIYLFIIYLKPTEELFFHEIIEGAGEHIDDLAALLKRHVECSLPAPGFIPSENTLSFLTEGLNFIEESISGDSSPVAPAILIAHGIVRPIVDCLCMLVDVPNNPDNTHKTTAITRAFTILIRLFMSSYEPLVFCQALKAGLLRAIVLHRTRLDHTTTDEWVWNALGEFILPSATVYRSVLSVLEPVLEDAAELSRSSQFLGAKTATHYGNFVELAKERLAVKKTYDSGTSVSRSACDNAKCSRIMERTKFKRCTGCRVMNYCSPTCQLQDWRTGGHRQGCKSLRVYLPRHEHLSTRDRLFLHALVHHDYLVARRAVLFTNLGYMKTNPGDYSLVTRMKYLLGRPSFAQCQLKR
ncbi:hypothetical protein DFH06DRAFT_259936 [Mycena polygramma]|nr:hypothetical protein DFH06DRAFT_259936 [Mycena polygramma]